MSNDTPRTDAFVIPPNQSVTSEYSLLECFARTLERETAQQAARIAELEEWQSSILGRLKEIPLWHSREWGGIKEGWGFNFEFIGLLEKTIAQLTERLATAEELSENRRSLLHQLNDEVQAERTRANSAESKLATALAQLGEAREKWFPRDETIPSNIYDTLLIRKLRADLAKAESALAAKTRELEECAELTNKWGKEIQLYKRLYETEANDPEQMVSRSNWLGRISALETAHKELSALIAARSAPPAGQKAL